MPTEILYARAIAAARIRNPVGDIILEIGIESALAILRAHQNAALDYAIIIEDEESGHVEDGAKCGVLQCGRTVDRVAGDRGARRRHRIGRARRILMLLGLRQESMAGVLGDLGRGRAWPLSLSFLHYAPSF